MSACLYFCHASVVWCDYERTILKYGITEHYHPFARVCAHSKSNPFSTRLDFRAACAVEIPSMRLARDCESIARRYALLRLPTARPHSDAPLSVVRIGAAPSGEWLVSSSADTHEATSMLVAFVVEALSVEAELSARPLLNGVLYGLEHLQERRQPYAYEQTFAAEWTR